MKEIAKLGVRTRDNEVREECSAVKTNYRGTRVLTHVLSEGNGFPSLRLQCEVGFCC